MNEQQRYLLIANKRQISQDLLVQHVFSYLQSKFVLTIDDIEVIKNEETSQRKAEKLLSVLLQKKKNVFNHFYDALRKEEYNHLADLLENGLTESVGIDDSDSDTDDMPDVEKILRDGGVPKLPKVYLKERNDVFNLRKTLENLKDDDGWVILHGMGGTGKTLLAAECLNDELLIYSCFPGGVFWLNIGNINSSLLLTKMQNLCRFLDKENIYQLPKNLEEARDRLRILFNQEYPRSLLILDDIWSEEVVKYFDIRARVLAVTRYSGVADRILANVWKVLITENLTDKESIRLLKEWTGKDQLPDESEKILEYTKGFPLALSMLGSLLKLYPKRWTYYLDQLEQQKISRIKSKIAYNYSSLYDAVAVSVENLDDKLKEYILRFAVFDQGVSISLRVLTVYFKDDEIEIEDTMTELCEHSLFSKTNTDQYQVHNITSAYLKERAIAENTLKRYHTDFVTSYKEIGAAHLLEDDGYIHVYFVSHMVNAYMIEDAVKLMTDIKWLEKMIKIAFPQTVIKGFEDIISNIENEVSLKRYIPLFNELSKVLKSQLHVLPPVVKNVDLCQMILSKGEPTPELNTFTRNYIQTKKNANEEFLFYVWVNKPCEVETSLLLSKHTHDDGINCCSFAYKDPSKVLTCGNDNLVKVWNGDTGEDIQIYEGHKSVVQCCLFSKDDEHIVSSSADGTIKVWCVATGKEELTIICNQDDVLSCDVSSDNQFIASASIDSTVKIWFFNNGFLYHLFSEHSDVVNSCSFSPDSKLLASCSNDSFIKIYDVEKKMNLYTLGGDKDFICFCTFSPDGKYLIGCSLNFVTCYSVVDGSPMWNVSTPSDVLSVRYSNNQKYLAIANSDMVARLFDVEKKIFVQTFHGHSSWLNDSCVSSNIENIITACADGLCKIWKIQPSKFERDKLLCTHDVYFHDDQIVSAVATSSNTLKVFQNGNLENESKKFESAISCCKFSVDGNALVLAHENGAVMLLKLKNLASIVIAWKKHVHRSKVCNLVVMSRNVASLCEDRLIIVWNLQDGEIVCRCTPHEDMITNLIAYGSLLMTSSYDGCVIVRDCLTGDEVFTTSHAEDAVLSCVCCLNYIATCTASGFIMLWDSRNGTHISTINGHEDVCRCLSFSYDERLLASGSDDGYAKIWSVENGGVICECAGHNEWITQVAFNKQQSLLMTVSATIKWFDMNGNMIQTFQPTGISLAYVKFSSNFEHCVTIDDLGYFYLLKQISNKQTLRSNQLDI